MRPMLRLRAYGLSAVLLCAAAYPLLLNPYDDDFPWSTYPMFADDRGRVATTVRAVAIDERGSERTVPAQAIANQEPMQALQTIRKAVRDGPVHARALCDAIATRLAQDADPAFATARHIELQTVKVDSVRFLGGDPTPLSRDVHVRCPAKGAR